MAVLSLAGRTMGITTNAVLGASLMVLFLLGLWDVLFNFEQNRCQMTYMFEYPDYVVWVISGVNGRPFFSILSEVAESKMTHDTAKPFDRRTQHVRAPKNKIELGESVQTLYPKYGLYVYGEGERAVQYHQMNFRGIPVLFIPGQAGSYRQARSLGSVLLRMAEKRQNSVTFDVFTADFSEEYAGLYGGFLSEQTSFIVKCLEHIRKLYAEGGEGVRVVLVGHSVGGMVARALFINPEFKTSTVDTIYTLSTPHRPVVAADEELKEFYDNVNGYWRRSINQTLSNVVLVSFAGGHRDVLVRSDRSDLTALFHNHPRIFSMSTTSIPNVWASTDHLCIVWCKQLVIAHAKSLFDMVDFRARQITVDPLHRAAVMQKYFANPGSSTGDTLGDRPLKPLEVRVSKKKSVEVKSPRPGKPFYQVLPVKDSVFIRSSFWHDQLIRLCSDSACTTGSILSVVPSRIPWFSEDPYFTAVIHNGTLKNSPFMALEIGQSGDFRQLNVGLTSDTVYNVSLWNVSWVFFQSPPVFAVEGKSHVRFAVHLDEAWEAITVRVRTSPNCQQNRGLLHFSVPGSFAEDTYMLIDREVMNFSMKRQTPERMVEASSLEMIADPKCKYEVTFRMGYLDVLGQIVRFYALHLPAFSAAVVVLKSVGLYRDKPIGLWDHVMVNMIAAVGICTGSSPSASTFLVPKVKPNLSASIVPVGTMEALRFGLMEVPEFYDNVNGYWRRSINQTLSNVVLVSFAGGHRDVLVRSDRSDLTALFHNHPRIFSMSTTSIPNVWASTDHLCIVWCKQLVIAHAKSLFDMVDFRARQITVDPLHRAAVMQKYFANPGSSTGDTLGDRPLKPLEVRVSKKKSVEVKSPRPGKPFYQVLPVKDSVFIRSSFWHDQLIRLCSDSACTTGSILSVVPSRIPWFSEDPYFTAVIHNGTLKNSPFMALEIGQSGDFRQLNVGLTSDTVYNVSLWNVSWVFFQSPPVFAVEGKSHVRFAVHLDEAWEAITVRVRTSPNCQQNRGLLHFSVPGSFAEDTYMLIDREVMNFSMKRQTPERMVEASSLEMIADPKCKYEVTFRMGYLDVLGQIVRFYALHLPAFSAAVVVLKSVGLYRDKPIGLWDHVMVNMIAAVGICTGSVLLNYGDVDVGFEGSSTLTSVELWILFYIFALSVTGVLEFFIHLAVSLYAYPVYFFLKPVVRLLQRLQIRAPSFLPQAFVFPVFALATSTMAYWTCGENGILTAIILYFIKLCYLRRNSALQNAESDNREQTQVILLALLTAFLNVVPTIIWTKNLPTTFVGLWKTEYGGLDPDPSFMVAIALGITLDLAGTQKAKKGVISHASACLDLGMTLVAYVTAAMILLYAQRAFYFINFFVSFFLSVLSVDAFRRCFFHD